MASPMVSEVLLTVPCCLTLSVTYRFARHGRGKHSPPRNEAFRQGHKTKHDANVNATDILPIVTIRDPRK